MKNLQNLFLQLEIYSHVQKSLFLTWFGQQMEHQNRVPPHFFRKKRRGHFKKSLGRSNNPIELIFYSRETSQPSYSFGPTQMGGEAFGEAKFQIENENNGHTG